MQRHIDPLLWNMSGYDKSADGKGAAAAKKRRKPRKATAKSLENAALYYLKRFSSSKANLARVLMRRVDKSARFHGTDRGEGRELVEAIVEKLAAAGLVDDIRYAEGRVRTLRQRGSSQRMIRAKLQEKGVGAETIDLVLADLEEDTPNAEVAAAVQFARRRRLGPFRQRPPADNQRERDMAALARAGFGYGLATKVIDAETVTAAEDLVFGGDGC